MERVPPLPLMREETMLPDRVEADLWGGSSVTVPLKEPQSIGWSCFPYDSIWQRVWDRVRLLHVPASSNTPFYLLLKITLVTCLAQVIDFGTRNPDHVTTTFVGILSLSPWLQEAKLRASDTLSMGLIGALVGTLIGQAAYFPSDTANWLYLLTIPWSVCTTSYILFFLNRVDPSAIATASFSALFVILIKFPYPPINDLVPPDGRGLIWQTLLVRVLALLTGSGSALVINATLSAFRPLAILKTEMYFTENSVWKGLPDAGPPNSPQMQAMFTETVQLLRHGALATKSAESWVFGNNTRLETSRVVARADVIFRFLNLIGFLEVCASSEVVKDEDRDHVNSLLSWLRREVSWIESRQETLPADRLEYGIGLATTLRALPIVLRDILQGLRSSQLAYAEPQSISRFWGHP